MKGCVMRVKGACQTEGGVSGDDGCGWPSAPVSSHLIGSHHLREASRTHRTQSCVAERSAGPVRWMVVETRL